MLEESMILLKMGGVGLRRVGHMKKIDRTDFAFEGH